MRRKATLIHIKDRLGLCVWTDETIRRNEPTMRIRNNWGKFSGYCRFKKGFYGLADISPKFQEKSDRTLEYSTPAWLDDIIAVTRGSKQDHERKLSDILNK